MKWQAVSVCPSAHLSVCYVLPSNSRTERTRKPKIDRMEAHHTGNPRTYLEVKRSKVKVTTGRLMLSQTLHHTQIVGIRIVA